MPTSKISADDIANYLLALAQQVGDTVTNLKLQKLVYYAQAWFLAFYNRPLFDDRLEAWVHGPAVPSLYRRFKRYQWRPILQQAVFPDMSKQVREHLDETFGAYARFSAWDLERMTHSERPWQEARRGLSKDENGDREISHDSMRSFYRTLIKAR